MHKYNYLLIFIFLFIILIGNAYADSITAAAVFEIENTKPVIESIEKVNNSLIIRINDQNGYKDILDDGYVNIISKTNITSASFKSGSSAIAIYEYKMDNNENIIVEVSDGKNIITTNYNMQENTPKITGYSIFDNKTGEESFLKRIIARILSWFK